MLRASFYPFICPFSLKFASRFSVTVRDCTIREKRNKTRLRHGSDFQSVNNPILSIFQNKRFKPTFTLSSREIPGQAGQILLLLHSHVSPASRSVRRFSRFLAHNWPEWKTSDTTGKNAKFCIYSVPNYGYKITFIRARSIETRNLPDRTLPQTLLFSFTSLSLGRRLLALPFPFDRYFCTAWRAWAPLAGPAA